ncbi:MAG: AMP-binding protein [Micromonosporaceae bacterium]|nr:AMP-binding protein [Micromonosporaceae bacterium]
MTEASVAAGPVRLPAEFGERTIVALLRARAAARPDAPAVAARDARGRWRRITYRELDLASDAVARGLAARGLRRGERVALMLSNQAGLEATVAYYGVHKAGAVNCPINTRFTAREVRELVELCDASAVIFEAGLSATATTVAGQVRSIRLLVQVGGDNPVAGAVPWDALPDAGVDSGVDGRLPGADLTEDDDADWLFTSGTTGVPKCVMQTHSICVADAYSLSRTLQVRPDDVWQSAFPVFTSAGCHFASFSALWAGACNVIEPAFDVTSTLELLQAERTTVYVNVPTCYILLLDSGLIKDADLSSVRMMDYGGAVMPPVIISRLFELVPGVELYQTYGLTEAGPSGLYLPSEFALSKLGSVGRDPSPLVQCRVVDEEGNEVGPGGAGEICYRGPTIMKGYHKNPDATAEVLRDGWLHSGDIVRVDEDGFKYHVDRKKDLIVRGGFNIAPAEIERVLYEHPAVLDAAVVGVPHDRLGEDTSAHVVLRAGQRASADELAEFCRERLADFKVPRRYRFVDALPRNPTGKVLRRELREQERAGKVDG